MKIKTMVVAPLRVTLSYLKSTYYFYKPTVFLTFPVISIANSTDVFLIFFVINKLMNIIKTQQSSIFK